MLEDLRSKIEEGRFEFSQRAVDQSIIRHISVQEIREAFSSCQIRGLIFGRGDRERGHTQVE